MATATATYSPPASISALIERWDPSAFDAPGGRARIRLTVSGAEGWDALVDGRSVRAVPASAAARADAMLSADAATWRRMAADLRGGMEAYRAGRLVVRQNLHLALGFLAATSGSTERGRLRLGRVKTTVGDLATMDAGVGRPVVLLHGLGATKASFVPTIAALAGSFRTIAIDLPGFGDSDKPLRARYDARFFARAVEGLLDSLSLERAHVVGHSMGGRVALEVALRHAGRVSKVALLTPSLAWRRSRPLAPWLRLVRPELGVLQPTSRRAAEALLRRVIPGADTAWVAAGVDEFLRGYLNPRGRAAFYAAARNIYLEEPNGPHGFWARLETLSRPALFLWGRRDGLVPIGFERHVKRAVPSAVHVEIDCGHVPQLERPRETHAALRRFLANGRTTAAARG